MIKERKAKLKRFSQSLGIQIWNGTFLLVNICYFLCKGNCFVTFESFNENNLRKLLTGTGNNTTLFHPIRRVLGFAVINGFKDVKPVLH